MLSNLTFYAEFLNFNNFIIKFMITDSQSALSAFNYVILL